ncbi:hypothetical protein ILUMI_14979 [Ignelater luminosus]|uniref:Uncharacterized protein n=1 Tax=Ignelater luminosus TaxID=2038154 RepID=A0A8K0G9J8_IGNLU|nr:hypothetical protein ILUMI_14979 [Ignelater luminosus]
MSIEEINNMLLKTINKAAQKVTSKQKQKKNLTDEIKQMLKERRKLLQQEKQKTIEFVKLNKLIRRSIKKNINDKPDKTINEVIERNQSLKVFGPNLGKNTIITLKDKNREEVRDKSKIEKGVQESYSGTISNQTTSFKRNKTRKTFQK